MNFCTLFDSNYIDRALVMYDSLAGLNESFTLYVVAFDKPCFDTLSALALPHITAVPYEEFEDEILKSLRAKRSFREYLWTCSGYSIRYLMRRFRLEELTYLDSDLFFYSSPSAALERFMKSDCDVAIISHRFSDHIENRYMAEKFGKYCVEFNTFKNTDNGNKILDWWIDRCIESCPSDAVDGAFGDQKYLDQFTELFDGVYEYDDFGMGIAPWNVDDFVLSSGHRIKNRRTGKTGDIVFYHFHSLEFSEDQGSNIRVFIRPGKHDASLVETLYKPYIGKLIEKRRFLRERFGLFDKTGGDSGERHRAGELRQFLTGEPSFWFLLRKIWRYVLYKKKDYISY